MCELLGIGRSLWEKIVDALIDEFDTARNNLAVVGEKSRLGRRAVGKKEGHISRRTVGVSLSSNPNHKAKSKTMTRTVVDKVAMAEIPPMMKMRPEMAGLVGAATEKTKPRRRDARGAMAGKVGPWTVYVLLR